MPPVLAGMAITHILFDLDDTLVAEESSAEAAFLATCEHARERYGVDSHALHHAVRDRAREAWFSAPTNAYCQAVGIASREGLWARFPGDDPNLKGITYDVTQANEERMIYNRAAARSGRAVTRGPSSRPSWRRVPWSLTAAASAPR